MPTDRSHSHEAEPSLGSRDELQAAALEAIKLALAAVAKLETRAGKASVSDAIRLTTVRFMLEGAREELTPDELPLNVWDLGMLRHARELAHNPPVTLARLTRGSLNERIRKQVRR